MTFSIVARSEDRSRFGVAVASKFLAVEAAVPRIDTAAGGSGGRSAIEVDLRVDDHVNPDLETELIKCSGMENLVERAASA